jgi:hypothetical protein
MKCPKCGYNSFEHLSACKKCHADLAAHKDSLGIRALVLPAFLQQAAPAPPAAVMPKDVSDDLFSWDIADNTAAGDGPVPFDLVVAPGGELLADSGNISFTFDDLPDSASTPGPGSPPAAGGNAVGDELTSFAGMLETIDREIPAPVTPDEFTFDDLEGFEKVDFFAEDARQKETMASRPPSDPDDFDALFSDEEKPGTDGT